MINMHESQVISDHFSIQPLTDKSYYTIITPLFNKISSQQHESPTKSFRSSIKISKTALRTLINCFVVLKKTINKKWY